jgi:hypothetical protein
MILFRCKETLAAPTNATCSRKINRAERQNHSSYVDDAMNNLGGTGLWDPTDGFDYDQPKLNGPMIPLRSRSLVGLLPLIAVEVLEEENIQRLPDWQR